MARRFRVTIEKLLKTDPLLTPWKTELEVRLCSLERVTGMLTSLFGSPENASEGYRYFGFHRTETGWVFREWLPGADAVSLVGDFNGWDPDANPLTKTGGGIWEAFFQGKDALRHGQHVKLLVEKNGERFERIPAYIRRTRMDERTHRLCGRIWDPEPFPWTDGTFLRQHRTAAPLIYEAHVGMAQEREGIGTYSEFTENNLRRIADLGYNTVQLMAIQEHPYYASFGYQVTNFFAPSSWFGEPEELKRLIDAAHGMGLSVLLDVVHSHASPNPGEGLHMQDGTEGQYFLAGKRGYHEAWGTRLFNYAEPEVLRFLLSNLRYWMEEFHFDGFRFDGVTSMIYQNHGLGVSFTDYSQYFGLNVNVDALTYLTLANGLVHAIRPSAVTVAEEMSGMPGMCLPIQQGGIGFDYRLAMGIPDYWIRLLKENSCRDWDMGRLWYELTTSRPEEKSISYCESHDQALVGDKTLIFRMAGAEMYTQMDKACHTPAIDAAMDMHRLIRFVTLATAHGGYLNFMGNEFGHPEWIDFPREGNGWSHQYARRQWSLADNPFLKYGWLREFDRAMLAFENEYGVLRERAAECIGIDRDNMVMAFSRGRLFYLFNFHPSRTVEDYFLETSTAGPGAYRAVFTTDGPAFGGEGRIRGDKVYRTVTISGKGTGFSVSVPCRTAAVFEMIPEGN